MNNKVKKILCVLFEIAVIGFEAGLLIWSWATTGTVLPWIQALICGVTLGMFYRDAAYRWVALNEEENSLDK